MYIFAFFRKRFCFPVVVALLTSIQGCAVGGNPKARLSTDSAAVTASVTGKQAGVDNLLPLGDQRLIRAYVAKAGKNQDGGLSWANKETGNRGVISALTEVQENGKTCRDFQTTRESYDGVLLFSGKACNVAGEVWTLVDLKAR